MWLLTDQNVDLSMNQKEKNLQLLAVRRSLGKMIFYVMCQSVEAVMSLAQFVTDGSLVVVVNKVVAGSNCGELQSLHWPVIDYNRCLHVFYYCQGMSSSVHGLLRLP
jgi:hypothetical protein